MKFSKLLRFLLMAVMPVMAVDAEGGGSFDVNENGEALGTGNDARIALMNKLADQADEFRKDEFVDIVDLDKNITEPFRVQNADGAQEDLADDTNVAAETAAALAAEAEEAAAANQAPVIPKLKVNGKDVDITPEMLAKLQKIEAADEYLKQAASFRNEAAAALTAKQNAVAAAEQAEDLVALTRAIQMGTEEEAVEAIRKIKSAGPSQDDIARQIDERVNFNTAYIQYRKDFADIVADPILNKLAIDKDNELVKNRDPRGYSERWAAIGGELREWKEKLNPTAVKQPEGQSNQASKQARKEAASGVVPTASATKQSLVAEEREPSVQEVIQAMAAARGGNQAMFGAPKM